MFSRVQSSALFDLYARFQSLLDWLLSLCSSRLHQGTLFPSLHGLAGHAMWKDSVRATWILSTSSSNLSFLQGLTRPTLSLSSRFLSKESQSGALGFLRRQSCCSLAHPSMLNLMRRWSESVSSRSILQSMHRPASRQVHMVMSTMH
ncbi:uncharacterized protein LOC135167701 isoform X2 [Diachasmimorpha longicaudata]|uniref:uncharacterized protein LOC135167701 isoform X2 n=1 Tax=Diachasmimorpha longicaudata TaxID=58733 RepID=UPI0030B8B7BE